MKRFTLVSSIGLLLVSVLSCTFLVSKSTCPEPFAPLFDEIPDIISKEKYSELAFSIRQGKCTFERIGCTPSKYKESIRRLQSLIGDQIPVRELPFDLRAVDDDEILYGFCSFPGTSNRLSGSSRNVEIGRFIEDIHISVRANDSLSIEYYGRYIRENTGKGILSATESIILLDALRANG